MFGFYFIIFLVIGILMWGWGFSTIRIISLNQKIICYSLLFILLVLVVTYRDGSSNPDYELYTQYIYFPRSYYEGVEFSFFWIVNVIKFIGGTHIEVFLVYAIIGIAIKMIAIYHYSFNKVYSICIWICYSFILHDLIQIRAAVAAGLLLLMIPSVYQKMYFNAILIWIIAFIFHNSAILFGILFFLKKKTINPWLWSILYMVVFIINITKFPIFPTIFKLLSILPDSILGRIGDSDPEILDGFDRMTMYSRYILIPTLFSFGTLYFQKKLQSLYPYTTLCLKLCFIGIYIYGIGLPIVSERLFEMLIVPIIYIGPLALLWFDNYRILKGKIIITCFCLFMSWNLLFKQAVFG